MRTTLLDAIGPVPSSGKLPRMQIPSHMLRLAVGRNGPFQFSLNRNLRTQSAQSDRSLRSVELIPTSCGPEARPFPFQRLQNVFLISGELEEVWHSSMTGCFRTTPIPQIDIFGRSPSSDRLRNALRSGLLDLQEMNPGIRANPKAQMRKREGSGTQRLRERQVQRDDLL